MIKSYRLKNLDVAPGLVLAPMSGVTCSALRRLLKELNPGSIGLVVSEFVSVEGMTRGSRRTLEMMRYREVERPIAIQIFGFDIDRMRDAALMVQDTGVDVLDINCGCPAPKVVRRGGGCELMRQPDHLIRIVRELRKVVNIPLTLKMRSGWDENSKNCLELSHALEQEGLDALAIHGRTRTQLYRGDADWRLVEEVASQVAIPVLGSGDVTDLASAEARLVGNIAGLLIGRGALSNPFVFSEIATGSGVNLSKEPMMVLRILERYIELLREDLHERVVVGRVKQLAAQMCRGYEWRKDLCRAMNVKEQELVIEKVREGSYISKRFETNNELCVKRDLGSIEAIDA